MRITYFESLMTLPYYFQHINLKKKTLKRKRRVLLKSRPIKRSLGAIEQHLLIMIKRSHYSHEINFSSLCCVNVYLSLNEEIFSILKVICLCSYKNNILKVLHSES